MVRESVVLPAILALTGWLGVQPVDPAAETARRLQAHYDTVRDFTADFSHTYEGGVLKKTTTERGTLQVKKPGRMRWEYTSPEHKLFVSDGQKIYSYIPADKQVIVSSMPADDQATTAVLFLVGKGNLTRDFTASYEEGAPPDAWALKLVPRQRQRDYDWLVLVVDRGSLQIRTLVAVEREGGRSTFEFTNYRENVGVADKIFAFRIPRGVDVINADSSGR
ncbi:MAG TPA: outer membrane lipoprotein chaperone LolA [Vicinamibacterales bacterium]|jgi:outer membrane lipoprotein carrier protein